MRCDIVIPVWNQLELTKDCIDSIVKNTGDVDYRIIVIDNASGEETKSYLEGLRQPLGRKLLLIRNENNLGFVKAANQGVRLSDASYVCLLNNDAVTANGWLGEMIRVAEASSIIGLVNPSSNTMGQKPDKGASIEEYALSMRREPGTWEEIGSAIGFCMLIKKDVINKIGVFDEIYGMGNFEDTDYSRRAIKAGFLCARASGAYVYHREGTSFGRDQVFDENFERNRQIYEFRWGKRRWIAYILDPVDEYMLVKFNKDALNTARNGFWVWAFSRKRLDLPRHSNIIAAEFGKFFCMKTLFKILFKKKRFSEIYVADERLIKVLEGLSFIHKAKVYSY
ncbi:MAG: glycosyltransferase family 2 protein [Candidatus Omnitrophota bacterium]|nr:glycosyltransferase family 2 protein [Candidatus Omnitrophota bacterium]